MRALCGILLVQLGLEAPVVFAAESGKVNIDLGYGLARLDEYAVRPLWLGGGYVFTPEFKLSAYYFKSNAVGVTRAETGQSEQVEMTAYGISPKYMVYPGVDLGMRLGLTRVCVGYKLVTLDTNSGTTTEASSQACKSNPTYGPVLAYEYPLLSFASVGSELDILYVSAKKSFMMVGLFIFLQLKI